MYYVNGTQSGATRETIFGGFPTSDEAAAAKASLEGEGSWTVGDVYESATDPRDDAPVPTAIVNQGDADVMVWSDGSIDPIE
jgi:hypothetical protein